MHITRTFLWYIGIKLASWCKISFMVGSQAAFFTATSIAMPLSGAFNSIAGLFLIFVLSTLLKIAMTGSFSWAILAYYIPGLCAALYWAKPSLFIRFLLPAFCIIAFCVHPVGFGAYAYSFYWFIPLALYFVPQQSLFLTALGSTFTAHAVGSVIWLYTVPMTSALWLALIPVVAVERMLFAAGMVVGYQIITILNSIIKNRVRPALRSLGGVGLLTHD